MTQLLARALQLVGMAILPAALYIGLVNDDVRTEVQLLFVGAAFFLVGRLMMKKE